MKKTLIIILIIILSFFLYSYYFKINNNYIKYYSNKKINIDSNFIFIGGYDSNNFEGYSIEIKNENINDLKNILNSGGYSSIHIGDKVKQELIDNFGKLLNTKSEDFTLIFNYKKFSLSFIKNLSNSKLKYIELFPVNTVNVKIKCEYVLNDYIFSEIINSKNIKYINTDICYFKNNNKKLNNKYIMKITN